jgi:hypothetical protein
MLIIIAILLFLILLAVGGGPLIAGLFQLIFSLFLMVCAVGIFLFLLALLV